MSRVYTTMQGDMWDAIAYKVYGRESYMNYLLQVNEQYNDVAVFPAGVTILIPDVPDVKTTSLPPWRR